MLVSSSVACLAKWCILVMSTNGQLVVVDLNCPIVIFGKVFYSHKECAFPFSKYMPGAGKLTGATVDD